MRPIKIHIEAFGAFADKVTLDFNELQGRNIFLIQGPTGSGKTTILDAMVYALYGQTSGDRSGAEMRSDYADPATETVVEFIFAIGQKEYRIVRTPEQIRNKQKGEGTTKVGAAVAFFEKKDDEWVQKLTKSREVDAKIESILGFKVEQFKQVILLPQGEFRKVLVANSNDRGKILSELFNTAVYDAFQSELNNRAKDAEASCKKALEKMDRILADEEVDTVEALQSKASELLQKEKDLAQSLEEEQAKKQNYSEWQKAIEERAKKLESIKEQELAKKELEARAEEMMQKKELMHKLQDYKEIHQIRLQRESEEKQYAEAQRQVAKLEDEQKTVTAAHEEVEKKFLQFQEGAEARSVQIAEKEKVEKDLQLWEQWTKITKALCDLQEGLDKDLALTEQKSKELKALHENIVQEKETLTQKQQKLKNLFALDGKESELRHALDAMKKYLDKEAKHKSTQKDIEGKQAELMKHGEERDQSERILHSLEKFLEEQEAYHVSSYLKENEPCPVCGSLDHPHKAEAPTDIVTKADVEDCRKKLMVKQQKCIEVEATINQMLLAYEGVEKELAEEKESLPKKELAQLEEEYLAIQEELKNRRALEGEIEALEKAIQEHEKEGESLKEAYDRIVQQTSQKTGEKESLEKQLAELTAEQIFTIDMGESLAEKLKVLREAIAAAVEEEEKLKEKRNEISTEKAKIDTALALAKKQAAERKEQWELQTARLEEAFAEKKLTEEEVLLLEERISELEELKGLCESYDRAVETTAALLDNARKEAAELYARYKEAMPILAEQEELFLQELCLEDDFLGWGALVEKVQSFGKAMDEILTEKIRSHGSLVEKSKATAKHLQDLETIHKENEEANRFYMMAKNLSDIAAGRKGKAKQFNFTNYVHRAILQEVLVAANVRLHKMSRRRYALEARPLAETAKGHQGLELSVMDAYTGVLRNVGTLSGGETFLASLSLALGMADVVQAYYGGTQMEAMFIDEGFGTLDEETLDIAMDALLQLQTGGRLIGIISHVDALKKRMDSHLIVTKGKKGSSARFSVGE